MNNVINLFFIILFVILIYNYSLYYFKYHKDKKKVYLSYDVKENTKSSKPQSKPQSTSKPQSQPTNNNCNHNNCKNQSECITTDTGYYCKCVSTSGVESDGTPFSGRTFSGKHCEFQNDSSLGVGVIFDTGNMMSQIVYDRKPLFTTENFQWNDFV